jgi:transketolase
VQKAYLLALNELAEKDRNVISIIADSGTGYDELFKRDFPDQFFDFGIAEEHMVAAAAGMAYRGKIPFVYTAGAFLAYRAYEFIRDDICLQRQNVKIAGMGSGLAWSTLGATHHTTEDIGVLRVLPGLTIFSPASPLEVRDVVCAAYKINGPVYIRLGMGGEAEIYPENHGFKQDQCVELKSGNDIAVFSTGSIIGEVLEAADKLREQDIHARVINVHTLKPMDTDTVIKAASETKMLFSVEEHNALGGLGGILAEILSENGCGVALKRIGIPDTFAAGYGTLGEVRRANNLDSGGIYNSICGFLRKSNGYQLG